MYRKGLSLTFALALLALTAIPVAAGPGESGGPCANILAQGDKGSTVGTTASYSGTAVGVRIELAAPSCEKYTYTLTVEDVVNGQPVTISTSVAGNGSSIIELALEYTAQDGDVCISASSGFEGKTTAKVLDRAPDSGCITLQAGQSSGGAGGNRMG